MAQIGSCSTKVTTCFYRVKRLRRRGALFRLRHTLSIIDACTEANLDLPFIFISIYTGAVIKSSENSEVTVNSSTLKLT
jgi:hypothetical protein